MTKYWFFHYDNPDWRIRRKWEIKVTFNGCTHRHKLEDLFASRVSVCVNTMSSVRLSIDESNWMFPTDGLDLYEDFPRAVNYGKVIVVSPQARCVLDAVAPGVFEYFPIVYTRNNSKLEQPLRLWFAHWLVAHDCFDRVLSDWKPSEDGRERYYFGFQRVVIKRSEIPPNAHIFELLHDGRLIFSDYAKRAVAKAKLVGAKFYPVPLSD